MKREKRLTKRERKALEAAKAPAGHHHHEHIHCTACGRHLHEDEFDAGTATVVECAHHTPFPSCVEHAEKTRALLNEHDRTGQPVNAAPAYH